MVVRGINEQNVGLVKRVGNIKLMFPPSYAAEAVVGFTNPAELKSALERFVEQYNSGGLNGEFPTLSRWAREENGVIEWDDLEARVRTHSEGMAHLLNSGPIKEESRSAAEVDYITVKRRGDARKGNDRSRPTTIYLDENGRVADYNCSCQQYRTGGKRGNFDDMAFVTHVACYHISAGLKERGLSPYQFKDPNVVLENLAMKVFRKTSQKSFLRDRFLLQRGIFTERAQEDISDGNLTIEVIWNKKNIHGRPFSILKGMKSYFEQRHGYTFEGFALDFPDTPYETTGIVLTKDDGRSVHLIYDENLQVGDLPFVMLKIPRFLWIEEGRDANQEPLLERNPVEFSGGKNYFAEFDQRTQSGVIAIIASPRENLLRPLEQKEYERILSTAA